MSHILQVTVHKAEHLPDVEHFGKNDPYTQITLDFTNTHSFQKTSIKKNAGKHAEWEQTLTLNNYDPTRQHNLYVEVLDDEKTVDAPIGFAAIPLHQVTNATNQAFRGKFNLFTPEGKTKGDISLTIAIIQPGQPASQATPKLPEQQGQSQMDGDHQHRMKALKNKERASDGASLAAGAALLVGAKYLHDQHKAGKKAHESRQEQDLKHREI